MSSPIVRRRPRAPVRAPARLARRPVAALAALLAAVVSLSAPSAANTAAVDTDGTMIRYHVTLPEHQAHRVHIRLTVGDLQGDHVEVAMPVWTPGSYLVREFARHVTELTAMSADGRVLAADKADKNTWRVATGGASTVHVDYALYANERSVRTNHVDADHAFLSPASTFLMVRGRASAAHHVTVEAPAGWRVFTSLPEVDGGWRAEDFDTLVDSPIEVGPHRELSFEVRGVPHRIVLAGETDVDGEKLVEDFRKISEEVASIFDLMPFDDYTFLVPVVDEGGGGLEHKNSSVSMVSRWKLDDKQLYRRFLALIAHEYFHAWNVKRFRPESLGPFDYDRENYTPDLWVAEGITSYYDDLATLRAGFADSVDDYLVERGNSFRRETERPGSRLMSLERSSRDAWIKLYRPDENSTNSSISYYSKGALVALMLDLRIRRVTGGSATLADALRLGWQRYTAEGRGFPPGAVAELAAEVAGEDLSDFFARYVSGTEPLEPDPELAWVGCELSADPAETERPLPRDEQGFALEPWLGVTTKDVDGLCRVDTVLEGGPAYHAGLNHDDVILAIDEMRVTPDTLTDRLDRTAGKPVTVTFYRGQGLRSLTIEPELRRVTDWKLKAVEDPTEAQLEAFEAWTGWDHPSRTPVEDDASAATSPVEADSRP